MRLVTLLGIISVIAAVYTHCETFQRGFNPTEALETQFLSHNFVLQEIVNRQDDDFESKINPELLVRTRRDVQFLMSFLPDISSWLGLLPPLLNTAAALLQQLLPLLQCCKQMPIPAPIVTRLLQCAQHPIIRLMVNGSHDRQESTMLTPVDLDLTTFFDSEICTAYCALDQLNLFEQVELLPRGTKYVNQLKVVHKTAQTCEDHAQQVRSNSSEAGKCKAANGMLVCMQRQTAQGCAESQRQSGVPCILQLVQSFTSELPATARVLLSTLLGVITPLLSPPGGTAHSTGTATRSAHK